MRYKLIEEGQTMLVIILNHLPVIGLGMTGMGLFHQTNHYLWLWSIMLVVPVVLYLARLKMRNFFLFFASHLAAVVVVFFIPTGLLPKLIMLTMTVMYVVWSISIRLKSKKMGGEILLPLFVIGVLVAMTLVENLYSKMGWELVYIGLAIIYIAGYFIYCFIKQYLHFLTVNESSAANIPEREIFASGMRQTTLFMAGSIAVLLLTANISWVSYVMSWLGKGLFAVLRFLFSGISIEETEELEPLVQQSMPEVDMSMLEEARDPAFFWVILEKIALTGTVVLLLGSVVIGIVMFFRYLWMNFRDRTKGESEVLQTGIDIREACAIAKNKNEVSNWFVFLNPREKVRKIYRKQVLKHKAEIIGAYNSENLEHMTARECCEKMSHDDRISVANLKLIYEKARYSAEEITTEDIKRIKVSGRS